MRFSIVIPLHRDSAVFRTCLDACLGLEGADLEAIVVSDQPVALPEDPRVIALTTGRADDSSPAEKRDLAAQRATGEAIAFLDDDAYPAPDWLRVAERAFCDPERHALGGPGLTPPQSPWRARVGGAVYESPLGSGPLGYRFRPGRPRVVDDYPAYNLIVRADAVRRAGGWASTFYGGEDTRFCEALAAIGAPVHYLPDLVVYHHRRPVFRAHMRQIGNVGRHRGHFARAGGTSRRAVYLMPLAGLLTAAAASAWALRRLGPRRGALAAGAAYAGLSLASPTGGRRERLAFPLALAAHHASYAASFAVGLLTPEMHR